MLLVARAGPSFLPPRLQEGKIMTRAILLLGRGLIPSFHRPLYKEGTVAALIRSAASKPMGVGMTAAAVFGLALILALAPARSVDAATLAVPCSGTNGDENGLI